LIEESSVTVTICIRVNYTGLTVHKGHVVYFSHFGTEDGGHFEVFFDVQSEDLPIGVLHNPQGLADLDVHDVGILLALE
jgi:hypothetical protein